MQYGICHLSLIPVRTNTDRRAELVTQLLYGEHFKVLERRKAQSRIRNAYDDIEGWADNNQFTLIDEGEFRKIESAKSMKFASDLVSYIETGQKTLMPLILGSSVGPEKLLKHQFEGASLERRQIKSKLLDTALQYLHAPYLWGGKTPFGIDAPGFVQMVYKINGYRLLRQVQQQAGQGEALSFLEESDPGDLAFFDNQEGQIDHVGLLMGDNHIIHSFGQVRIDRIDHTGIFNKELGSYTHKLRVLKKII
ncbi:MAG: C40 family peptidase [Flavobacteriaceae bacterium]